MLKENSKVLSKRDQRILNRATLEMRGIALLLASGEATADVRDRVLEMAQELERCAFVKDRT